MQFIREFRDILPNGKEIFEKISFVIFFIALMLTVRYQLYLLDYIPWGDESETIVAAKMMADGSRLYNEIFNHHGPLIFLPGFILELFGSFGVQSHRVFIMLLQWLALISLYYSPLIVSKENKRFLVIIAGAIMVVILPIFFGHMYKYQTIGGLVMMIILAQLVLPSIMMIKQKSWITIVCTSLLISLPFLSLTYLPAAILLLIISIRRSNLKQILTGVLIGVNFNLMFLVFFSSIKGYLAYHIYLNSQIYAADTSWINLVMNIIDIFLINQLGSITLVFVLIAMLILIKNSTDKYPWRSLLLVGALLSFGTRGFSLYHLLPYWYSLLGLIIVFFVFHERNNTYHINDEFSTKSVVKALLFLIVSFCIIKLSLLLPGDLDKIQASKIPKETEFSNIVKIITNEDDKILALSFRNYEYIASNRLPASAHFFYLPFQAYYNENPKYGIYSDLKEDIIKHRPKIILADKWKVPIAPEPINWEEYADDIDQVLEKYYYKIKDRPYYIRNDIQVEDFDIALTRETNSIDYTFTTGEMIPIGELTAGLVVEQLLPTSEMKLISGIEVIFATYLRFNKGYLQAEIEALDGEIIYNEIINVAELQNSEYYSLGFAESWHNTNSLDLQLKITAIDSLVGEAVTILAGENFLDSRYNAYINEQVLYGKGLNVRINVDELQDGRVLLADISDQNWEKGIRRGENILLFHNNSQNRYFMQDKTHIITEQGSQLKIIDIHYRGEWIHIAVEEIIKKEMEYPRILRLIRD